MIPWCLLVLNIIELIYMHLLSYIGRFVSLCCAMDAGQLINWRIQKGLIYGDRNLSKENT